MTAFIPSAPTPSRFSRPSHNRPCATPRCSVRPSLPQTSLSRRALFVGVAGFAFATMSASEAAPGLGVEDLSVGQGAGFTSGENIKLHYTLTLGGWESDGGKVVDSSRTRGRPFSYQYDTGSVIKGWDLGVAGMRVGGHRRIVVPSELGYGAAGAGGVIPPNSTLYFDIELLDIGY